MSLLLKHLQHAVDEEPLPTVRGGSRPRKVANIDIEWQLMHHKMKKDYYCDTHVFDPSLFWRRYRMSQTLFVMIMEQIWTYNSYFIQKVNACGLMGLTSHQNITCVLHMLAYETCADVINEYCQAMYFLAFWPRWNGGETCFLSIDFLAILNFFRTNYI